MLFLRWYFWTAPNVIVATCILLVLRFRFYRRYPTFTSYLGFTLLYFAVLLALDLLIIEHVASLETYRWTLNVSVGFSAVLELGVLHEIAKETIPSDRAPIPLKRMMQSTAAALLLVSAVISAMLSNPGLDRAISVFQSLDFSANLLKIGLLLVLISFTSVLGISWKSLPTGIALGFGVSAAAEMSGSAFLADAPKSAYISIDLVRMAAFHLCALIWLFYIVRAGKRPSSGARIASQSELELWNQELGKMVRL